MKISIWKYPLEITKEQNLEMPFGAEIISVQMQDDKPQLWAIVKPNALKIKKKIRIVGTGNPIKEDFNGRFIDTIQIFGDTYHIFEVL